jgi:catechol 2,3-dioxygenase-like lactoylglutathione lyase family enzyme
MSDFVKCAGVFHVGFGVRNLEAATKFYMETLELSESFTEFDMSVNPMADTFRNSMHIIEGNMFYHKTGGLTLEPVCKKAPTPKAIFSPPRLGDIGPNKITFAVADVEKFFQEYQDKVEFFGKPHATVLPGLGDYSFVYGKDPEGNILEFASWADGRPEQGMLCGARILGVAVTDLERAKSWYQKHCDMDIVVSEHDKFSGLVAEVSGSPETQVKSCLLDTSKREHAPVGTCLLELYEVSKPSGRSIPMGSEWGDYGFMELSMVGLGSKYDLARYYEEQGVEIAQRPTAADVMEGNEVWFIYAKDPDGNYVETVGFYQLG